MENYDIPAALRSGPAIIFPQERVSCSLLALSGEYQAPLAAVASTRHDASLRLQTMPGSAERDRVNRRRYHITLIIQRDTSRDVFPLA